MNHQSIESPNVVSLGEFRFDTLHRYMNPIYAELDRNLEETRETKQTIIKRLIPAFFRRMREYRQIPIPEIAKKYSLSKESLADFELGAVGSSCEFAFAYIAACGGQNEFEFFEQAVREFQEPRIKEFKRDVALSAFFQFGIRIPGVDCKSARAPAATMLELKRPGATNNLQAPAPLPE